MSELENLTVTLPAEMLAAIKTAVARGDYSSTNEVIGEALRKWKLEQSLQQRELSALRADIEIGLDDITAGRLTEFDPDSIIERGRTLLAGRAPSA